MPSSHPSPAAVKPSLRRNQLIVAGAVLVFLLVFGELWRRISQAADLRGLEHQIGAQVTQLSLESDRMATLVAGAQSDEAVAEWARNEGRMILPGEVLVQPIAPTAPAGSSEPPQEPETELPNWRVWWEWLWGEA